MLLVLYLTVVPPLGIPLKTVTPLSFSVGKPVALPVQSTAIQVNPVLVPVSTIFIVLPVTDGVAGNNKSPEVPDVGVEVAFRAMSQVADEGIMLVKERVPASTVVAPEYVLVPLNVSVPVPTFIKAMVGVPVACGLSSIAPAKLVLVFSAPTWKVLRPEPPKPP